MSDSVINMGINGSLVLIGLGIILAVVFAIVHAVTNFKESYKGLIGVAILLAFLGIMYMTSSGEIAGVFKKAKYESLTNGTMQWVTAGIKATLGMLGFAFIAMVVMEFVTQILTSLK